jgi:hypothetical protein
MERNPHWDETINEDITITDLPPWSPQQEWGDVGGGGEFSGSRREEVLPSPNMPGSWRGGDEGWENYPSGEFTGIETISPNIGGRRGVLQAFPRGITSLGENYVRPPWWETQMGGKAYGPFHKSGSIYDAPQDYPGLMKLEPGQNYSYLDLAGNPMLNQSEWSEYSPYRRSNPLIQDLSGMAGSQVPDELLFEDIGDGNFKWNPWQSEDVINARHWLPEEYSIDPGIDQFEDVFQFRKFPWMED